MKNKILILFALFILMLPITGCEDKENVANVNVELEARKSDEEDTSFALNDCIRLSGGGTYEYNKDTQNGANVELNAEINPYCKIEKWEYSSGNLLADKDVTRVNVTVSENTRIYVYVSYNGRTDKGIQIRFDGIWQRKTSSDGDRNERLDNSSITFAKSSSTSMSNPRIRNYSTTAIPEVNSNSLLRNIVFESNSDDMDLNYIYVNGEFKPYKLQWYLGSYDDATDGCNYSVTNRFGVNLPNDKTINDLTVGDILGTENKEGCIRAILDVSHDGMSSTEAQTNQIEALNRITNGHILYICKNNSIIETLTTRIPTDSSDLADCYFVGNLMNLTSQDNADTIYYGRKGKNIEAVVTSTSHQKKYYFGTLNNNNQIENAKRIPYNYDLESLAINEVFNDLYYNDSEDKLDNEFNKGNSLDKFDDIKYGYNSLLKEMVPASISVNGKTYYFVILSSSTRLAYGGLNFGTSTSDYEKYSLNFTPDGDVTFDDLKTEISSNLENLTYSTNDSNTISENILGLIYTIIGSKYQDGGYLSEYGKYVEYIYSISVNTTSHEINVTPRKIGIIQMTDEDLILENDSKVICMASDVSDAKCKLAQLTKDFINIFKGKTLQNLDIKSITEVTIDHQVNYIITFENNSKKYEMTIDNTNNIIKIVQGGLETQITIYNSNENKISYEFNGIVKFEKILFGNTNFVQEYNISEERVTTTVGGSEVTVDESTNVTKKVYDEHIKGAEYYRIGETILLVKDGSYYLIEYKTGKYILNIDGEEFILEGFNLPTNVD